MSRTILVLEPSVTMQELLKVKLSKLDVSLSFETTGMKMLASMYNNLPDAILVNARTINPKCNELVRLIKCTEKFNNIPVGVYAATEFLFHEHFMKNCGADVFFMVEDDFIEDQIEALFDIKGSQTFAQPVNNDLLKNGISQKIFELIENLDSVQTIAQKFLCLLAEFCKVPAMAMYLDEKSGQEGFYVCSSNFTETELSDFLEVCGADFEDVFVNASSKMIEVKKLDNLVLLDEYHTSEVPLSAYQCFPFYDSNRNPLGTVHVVKEGTLSSYQLDIIAYSVEHLSLIMENAVMLKGKQKFEKNVRKAFSRFVPEQIIDELVEGEEKDEGGGEVGEKRDVAILFSDIRSFTNISERNRPEVIVAFLNRYFTTMCTIIKKYGGTIDKFIGDAIMALFGAPVSYEDNARRAVAAAYEMREALGTVPLEDLVLPEGMKFNIGIGIHYGDVIVGSIGSSDKTDYSVIGDNVNLASRLEGLTKTYGTMILVSGAVKDDIKTDEFVYRYLDDVKVKGKANSVPIFAVDRNSEEFSEAYRDAYSKGLSLYQQGVFNLAYDYFQKALAEAENDKATALMIERCKEFIENPPENWDGAIKFNTK